VSGLDARLRAALGEAGVLRAGDRVVVAVSGGLDSVALLHLARFGVRDAGVQVVAAHFDHAMRATSREDACWVAGLCRAWGVPLHLTRASERLASEEEAREARYAFLERVRVEVGARLVLTAHHADDQAETVLFRALRGSGVTGLAGIPARREPALWRPLLGFWREELEAYAARARLAWREDPTNAETRFARNALRTLVIPQIEGLVAPGARQALVRLADLARAEEAGWSSVLPALLGTLGVARAEAEVTLDRASLIAHHPAVGARVLRALGEDVGLRLDEARTSVAIRFASEGASGKSIELGGGWVLERRLDRLALVARRPHPADVPVVIQDRGPGAGDALLAGSRIRVVWGGDGEAAAAGATPPSAERFDPEALRFPLVVRAREPGDRIRLASGTKKLKKLFLERRVPHALRGRTPLLVDAEGDILWIPRVARAVAPRGRMTHGALGISIG